MKKFVNDVDQVEKEMLQGFLKANPAIVELPCGGVLVRKQKKDGKVAIISGGGSGHEPAFGGYIGTGMLDAVAAGRQVRCGELDPGDVAGRSPH